MTNEFFRHPTKRLEREFRALGGRVHERRPSGVSYQFPDGGRFLIPAGLTQARAHLILRPVMERYGATRADESPDPLRSAVERPGAPEIAADRVVMSKHARGRFELMASQARVQRVEITDALRFPERVLWNPLNSSWLWVRGRIIVAASVNDEGTTVIRTILWATHDLWEQNPRPGQDIE